MTFFLVQHSKEICFRGHFLHAFMMIVIYKWHIRDDMYTT